jgi:hypothetical protein
VAHTLQRVDPNKVVGAWSVDPNSVFPVRQSPATAGANVNAPETTTAARKYRCMFTSPPR